MPLRIEDYALVGDTQTVALVGRDGSFDWMCVPRFDSGACFAALLGGPEHGRWLIAPQGADPARTTRSYRDGTLVLDTTFTTPEGRVKVTDCMPPRDRTPDVVRVVEGLDGAVPMRMELVARFDYGSVLPWVRRLPDRRLRFIAGADSLYLHTDFETRGEDLTTVADFTVRAGQRLHAVLSWQSSHEELPPPPDAEKALADTEAWWREWSSRCSYEGPDRSAVYSSLLVLRALSYAPTGGIVAAPTTSLPEQLGGPRNWDYRYCWLRDATFTLQALIVSGYTEGAQAWREWLLRAIAGRPSQIQIMYGLAGERQLAEWTVPWLIGYEGAAPVRIGNAAARQLQLDVYGEIMDVLYQAGKAGVASSASAWELQRALVGHLETIWDDPDEGIWEVRGGQRHFTHSKVMSWVAVDRAVRAAEENGLDAPLERWRRVRQQIHDDICTKGFDTTRGAFVQAYGSQDLDASLLLLPLVGFLPPEDPRVRATVEAIEKELLVDGFVQRYHTGTGV